MFLLKEVKTQRIFAYREHDKQRKTRRQPSAIQKNELLTGDSCFGRKITRGFVDTGWFLMHQQYGPILLHIWVVSYKKNDIEVRGVNTIIFHCIDA